MWFWNGNPSDAARKVKIKGLKDLRRAEGITPVRLGNAEGILIFSDEGETGELIGTARMPYWQLNTPEGVARLEELGLP